MLKKTLLSLALAVIISICATPFTFAQMIGAEAALLEATFANEPPLTQADINAFIKIGPEMVKAATANDTVKAAELLKQAGWTEIRGSYVTAKIGNAYAINLNPEMASALLEAAGMPAFMMPTPNEQELVRQNINALNNVFVGGGF